MPQLYHAAEYRQQPGLAGAVFHATKAMPFEGYRALGNRPRPWITAVASVIDGRPGRIFHISCGHPDGHQLHLV